MRNDDEKIKEIRGKKIIEFLILVLIGIVLGLILVNLFGVTEVYGSSMYPTIESEDRMFINKVIYKVDEPKRGDIIVFNSSLKDDKGENKSLIKRIVGIPGDRVIVKGGKLFINGKMLNEPYLDDNYTSGVVDVVVEDEHYFVLGDNRVVSRDSRDSSVGTIDKEDIVGKASIRYFPFNNIGVVK